MAIYKPQRALKWVLLRKYDIKLNGFGNLVTDCKANLI